VPLKKIVSDRLAKIIGFRWWRRKKSRGRGISPVRIRARGRLKYDPKKIPATQAQLR